MQTHLTMHFVATILLNTRKHKIINITNVALFTLSKAAYSPLPCRWACWNYRVTFAVLSSLSVNCTQASVIPRLHDKANIKQTSSKCIQNTRVICSTSGVCSTFAQCLLDSVNGVLIRLIICKHEKVMFMAVYASVYLCV